MTTPCYEIVTYKVKNPQAADSARALAQSLLKHFPGFVDWIAFSGRDMADERVDLVVWNSAEDALAAAKAVGNQPEFSSFRSSVSDLHSMGHYAADTEQTPSMKTGHGIEIGRFRLKPGIHESDMRNVYNRMVENHLALQPGWKSQHLVSLGNGVFVDLAFADDRQHAEAICASWQGQAVCDAFLDMIEPESMEFGSLC
ncbi:hypothetical protein [Serratia plymuthica]|uniref:hypothetical protein n=1 Tax=Serratia plymuthica TaxID=82996 RepID=UPI0018D95963|nr:hypothetical protein [Serratia plymuthica]QPS54694.1 hypothetical protein I6G53_18730 [Serratia plymuthica]CAI1629112.1 Uncharacterised protein [Serratia plymuthica]